MTISKRYNELSGSEMLADQSGIAEPDMHRKLRTAVNGMLPLCRATTCIGMQGLRYVVFATQGQCDCFHVICIRSIEVILDVKTDGDSRKDSVLIIHAVFCPVAQSQLLSEFWRLVGTAISSRLAEYCVKHLTVIQDVTSSMQDTKRPNRWCNPHHRKICQRIVDLVRRGPIRGGLGEVLARDDVYLFQTGMSAIFHTQELLNRCFEGQCVMFGFLYELTLTLLETYGPPVKFYPFGSDEELGQVETFLIAAGKKADQFRPYGVNAPQIHC